MGRTNSVAGVSTKLFEEGWDKIGGSRSPGSLRHMARAAQGASPAFFKMIRTGSCSSKEQISAQFNYLFSKSVDVHDSRGLLDGEKRLTPEQIERAVSRWTEEWRGQLNAARTSHMVMSFPRGAKSNHVSLIAGEICKEKLGGRFDYMIAVHTDSPNKNPHAHIIVNRRGEDGNYFILRQGTEYTYQAFKEAMVDHAAQYGIQLEATSRLQRGHINYPPTDGEWRRAQEKAAETGTAFEAPTGKPRVAEALNRATEEIRNWSLRYRDLASYASQGNWQDLANAFEKASAVLAEGGAIVAKADPYISIAEGFDKAIGLKRAVDDAEGRIADAAPNQRPAMERKLSEALAAVEHMQPLGLQSRGLSDPASEQGIYSPQNLVEVNTHLALLGRDPLREALDGTGIDPVEVEARMRATATSAALETRWVQQDLQSVADLRGLDLRDAAQLRQAIAVVDRAYDRVAADYGVDDAIYQRAAAQRGAALERSERDRKTAGQIERARDTVALERAPVMPISSQGGTSADHSDLRRYARPVGAEDERLLRQAVERSLSRAELAALKAGDAEVLRGVGDREDQLTLARDYLRASNDPAVQQGIDRVSEDLSAERDRVRQERGHEEGGHGSG